MAERAQLAEAVARRYSALRAHLDERQRRLLLGSEAVELGWGGVKAVAAATGAHPDTVARGKREIEGEPQRQVRVRRPGGGRKKLSETDPELAAQLRALVEPETRGRSDVAVGVDDEVDQEPGCCAGCRWPSGVGSDGGPDAARDGL